MTRPDGRRSTAVPFDGAVHRRAGDAEEVAKLRDAVLTGAVQGDEVGFLPGVQLRLLAPEPALGFGDAHSFTRSQPYEVPFKLGDHRQHVEEQSSHGIGGVVDGAAQAELDLPPGEVLDDGPGVGKRAGQSVQLGDDKPFGGGFVVAK